MTQVGAVGERVQMSPCLRLQLKVKVLWVEVVNSDVAVFSSAAVAASMTNAAAGSMLAKVLILRETIDWRFRFLPLAVGVERNAVDGSKVTFDPSKFLFIGGMEKSARGEKGVV